MYTRLFKQAGQMLAAGLLVISLLAAAAAVPPAEVYSGNGLVFSSDGTLFFEAEEGGLYRLDGLDLADFEGVVVTVTGTVQETEDAEPLLFVTSVHEDEANSTSEAPRPATGSEHQ